MSRTLRRPSAPVAPFGPTALLAGIVAVAAGPAAAWRAADPPGLVNGGFEVGDGRTGGAPGWMVPPAMRDAGARVERTADAARSGDAGLRIDARAFERGAGAPFINVLASVPAEAWRARPFRLEVHLRVDGGSATDRAQAWMRVDRPGGAMGFFENMGDRPVTDTSGAWVRREITGTIDADAAAITIGVMVFGDAVVDVDDVALVATGEAIAAADLPIPPPPALARIEGQVARALDERGRRNLVALARAAGQVRWFHPSPSVEATDWDGLVPRLIERVEDLPDDDALAAALVEALAPIAPGVQAWTGLDAPAPGDAADAGASARREHRGFTDPNVAGRRSFVYRSERVVTGVGGDEPMRDDRMPVRGWIPPGHAVETELVPGVWFRLPVHVDAAVDGAAWRAATDEDAGDAPGDRALRLAGVTKAWNVLQHFFPYHDLVESAWETRLAPALDEAAVADSNAGYLRTLEHLVDPLDDGHVRVNVPGARPMQALPLRLGIVEDEVVVLASSIESITAGDVLLALDGRPIDDLRAEGERRICGSPQWTDARMGDWLAMRASGPTSRVVVRRADGSRDEVELACVGPGMMPIAPTVHDSIAEIEPGIWYVDLGREVMMDLDAAIRGDLASADAIVWDMRGYPSGLQPRFLAHMTDVMVHSATWNVAMIRLPERRQWEWATSRWAIPPSAPRLTRNAVMLIGGGSISYAESIAGLVEMHDLAVLVGGPTAGANGNVTTLALHGGAVVSWTGMRVTKHDGSPHHVVGVLPDVAAAPTIAGVRAGRDEVLERGLAVLKERARRD